MPEIIPDTLPAKSRLRIDLAGPALFESCGENIGVLAAVADLPNLPTQLRIDIAKAMAKACEARHLAIHGRINPPAQRAQIKEDA